MAALSCTPLQHGALLIRLADLPEGRAETYAHLITAEMGKPLPDAIAESRKPALDARHKAEEADEAYHKPQPIPRVSEQISYELVGPIFSVQPWNLPSYA
jgi:succinate-semialdehyde dehydrogenase/glutarate-semialdehyde dehydrogenase/succinate-semialdehyde dehydrogenase